MRFSDIASRAGRRSSAAFRQATHDMVPGADMQAGSFAAPFPSFAVFMVQPGAGRWAFGIAVVYGALFAALRFTSSLGPRERVFVRSLLPLLRAGLLVGTTALRAPDLVGTVAAVGGSFVALHAIFLFVALCVCTVVRLVAGPSRVADIPERSAL